MGVSPHLAPLDALGLAAPVVTRVAAYLDTLGAWGRRINLTGARTPRERVERLVAAVVPVVDVPEPGTLIDVGSGNGSPGLVLALLRDDLEVTLLEPRMRRWAFLREAARSAGRPDIRVVRSRHDTYVGEPARTVTMRALALPLGELEPLLQPAGQVVVLGRPPVPHGAFEPRPEATGGRADVHVFRLRGTDVPRGTSGSDEKH